jgi:hypothetical protein
MEAQAKAFLDHAAAEHLPCSIVTRDYDSKFSNAFDQVFKDRAIQVKPVGPQAPNLNAFVERWIQSLQLEALNHFICFGEQHFDFIVSSYCDFYHNCRPHQGVGNVLLPRRDATALDTLVEPDESAPPPLTLADIKCEARLGGLLKHFYRKAA